MIRRLIILLLIVGCVFGDTIVFKVIGLKDKYSDVEYLGILDNKVYYLEHNFTYSINCNKVIEIINSDGNKIDFNCSSNTYTPKTLTELDAKARPILGGICIGIGSGILLSNVEPECDDCSTPDKLSAYMDEYYGLQRIGYTLIAIGGILVALGI